MNTVIYLVCLINLVGIALLVFVLESHSRLHKKIRSLLALHECIIDLLPDTLKFITWNSNASYWQLLTLKMKYQNMQSQFAEREMYEAASQCQRIIVNIDNLIENYPSKDTEDNGN